MDSAPVPIALLVDDPTPVVHLYRHHMHDIHGEKTPAAGGKPLVETVPNAFLGRFCDVVQERGIRGKFSIVPSPAGRGDVAHGVAGHDPALTREWMDTVKRRLSDRLDFCPEMITHSWAVDLATGKLLNENENDWSQRQTRETLTPYIARALSMLKEAGIDATGVTSPWMFGEKVEKEYVAAIVEAQKMVNERAFSWYFLHVSDDPATKPKVAHRGGGATLVSISSSMDDMLWDTIWKHAAADRDLVSGLADKFLTADGRGGKIRAALDAGGWPVLLCHWQTLYSNGAETGLAVIDEVAKRVEKSLAGWVKWMTCMEMARLTAG